MIEGAPDSDLERRLWLQSLETWWANSNNPLFVWEAIMLSEDPLPEFCKQYLRDVAIKLTRMARGCAALAPEDRAKDAKQAVALSSGVLGLTREREKNAFARYADDAEAIRASILAKKYDQERNEVDKIAKARNVTRDPARRILSRGHRLTGKT